MKLPKRSWHFKLYSLHYGETPYPSNLCPYFWKVIWALIVFIPLQLISLPGHIWNKIENGTTDWRDGFQENNSFIKGIGVYGIAMILCSIVNFWLCITGIWNIDYGVNEIFAVLGALVQSILLIVLIVWIIKKTMNKSSKPNILTEFVKAKYNKYCPKIDWD